MDKINLIFPYSPFFLLLCVGVGVAYAWLLYSKNYNWSKKVNYSLAALRGTFVTLICLLLLAPIVRKIKNDEEKPTIVFAIDNSESLKMSSDTAFLKKKMQEINNIKEKLEKNDILTDVQFLDDNSNKNSLLSTKYNLQSSNLGKILSDIESSYENRNLDRIVLVSDGIHNQGVSPTFQSYNNPIITVGLGDTIAKKDLKIQTLFCNKLAYLGNDFPIVAEIQNNGYNDRIVAVSLLQNGAAISTQNIRIKKDDISEVNFVARAAQKGLQRYSVAVQVLENEISTQNNVRDAYVEIIDGKEKILLLAYAPHPDLKALRAIIEKNENYGFELCVVGIHTPKEARYDLIIAHQIPDLQNGGTDILSKYKKLGVPVFYILGEQSNLGAFSAQNDVITTSARTGQSDNVLGAFNPNFTKFSYNLEALSILSKLPPLSVPYGDYQTKNNSDIILFQQVGSVITKKPLLAINSNKTSKYAVLAGEGLWRWRLEEYDLTDKQEVLDDFFLKIIQFLSSKEDTRKLRVFTTDNEYLSYEKVVFEAESYNDVFEKIYNTKVNLSITNEAGQTLPYNFVIAQGSSRFEVSGLPKGVYRYKASANILGKLEIAVGEFTIKDLQLEALNTTADHQLLRELSAQTEGKFFNINQLENLEKELLSKRKPNKLTSTEEMLEIIHLRWLFFLIVLLASIEWVARKYLGSY